MTTTALILSTWLALVCGADPVASPAIPTLQRVDFAADHPETWPRNIPSLEAMPREEFEQLWASIQPKRAERPRAVLERAVYQAAIVHDRLQGGTLSAEVRRTGSQAGWLRWTPCNLALADVRWQDGPAVFGADPQGQHWLLADRAKGEFTATWTRLGRRLGNQTEFALEIPAALSSTVVLRVPRGQLISCTDSTIPVEANLPEEGWVTWRIDMGSREKTTIVVRRAEEHVALPLLTYRKQVTAGVSEDHLQFQIVFTAEVLDAPVQDLIFTLPKAVELYSVTYGAETPLTWTNIGDDGNRARLRVRLPDGVQGDLRPLRFDGIWPRRPNTQAVIPQLELVDAVFLGGRHNVTLLRPLELSSIEMTGCREAAAVTPGAAGDTYQFQQFLPEALLKLNVRRPISQLTAQVLSAVTFDAEEWTQRTDLLWSTLSGSAFQVSTRIPRGWEVTDVDAFTSSGAVDPINWDVTDDADETSRLSVEFLEAVTPTSPRIVRLLTRQRRTVETRTVAFPVPRPLTVASAECVLALQGQGAYRFGLPHDPAVVTVTPTALPESWRAIPLWNKLSREEEKHPAVWCRTDGNDIASVITLEREPARAAITTHVTANVSVQALQETYRLTIRPEGRKPFDRVLAYVTESGGELNWSVVTPQASNLVAIRLPLERHAMWNLPTSGELWDISLPETTTTEWELQAERTRGMTSPVRIGLMITPQSTSSEATVVVPDSKDIVLEWAARGLEEMAHSADDGPNARRWRYTRGAELIGDVNPSHAQSARYLCDGRLQSTLAMTPGEFDLHELRLVFRGLSRPLTLSLPNEAEWLTATVNGTPLTPDADRQLRIPANMLDDKTVLDWVYRVPTAASLLVNRRQVPWPTGLTDPVWTRFEWDLRTPPGAHADATASGLRTTDRSTPITWRRRLFGPLARTEFSPLFLPWKWYSWTHLEHSAKNSLHATVTKAEATGPTGWITQQYFGPAPPATLIVDVIDLSHSRSFAWLSLIGSAAGLLILRATGWALRNRLAAFSLSVCLAVSFWCDGVWIDIIGGAIAGIMISGLLPRRWWQPTPVVVPSTGGVPGGSTQSFVISQPIGLFLCLALGLGACWATEGPVVPREGIATVYVPIDADGRPSRRLDFVYLAPDLLKRLRELETQQTAESPAWLIERADYRVSIGPEPRTGFSVTYRILAPSGPAIPCDLMLPSVTLSGPQSCLIDGRPAAVSSLPGKRGLRVIIPASSAPVSAVGAVMVEAHEVMLDFDHPWRRQGIGGSCELPLPRAATARAEVTGLSPTSEIQLESVLGGWERSLDSRQVAIAMGPTDRFRLQWHERTAVETKSSQPVHVSTTESLKVTAAALEVRCRSTIAPQMDSLTRFAWDFPAETHFRNLQVRPAGKAEVTTLPSKVVRVTVDFYEPVHDQAAIEAEFVVRHAPHLGEFVWRGVTPVEIPGIQFDRRQRLWAVSAVSELRVEPQSVENSGLVPVAAESVRDRLTGLTSDRAPQAIYQVGTDNPIAFRWTTIAPRRRLLLWQQRGEVVGSRLRWTVEADLEATTQPPAYSHTFLVDRRLQIDQVTVRERGADRLLRFTESRSNSSPLSRVTLWLTDPCLETQRITLTAHMPLSTSGAMTLPNVRCEDADLVGGRLELQSTRELRGTWQPGGRGLKPLSMADDRIDVAQHWIFEQTEVEPRAIIRFQTQQVPGTGRGLYALTAAENGQVRLRTRWEMPATEMLSGLQITVPRPWTLEQTPLIQGGELASTQETDRGMVLLLGPIRRPAPMIIEVVLRAPRPEFVQRDLSLPTLSHDPGLVIWMAEAARAESAALLAGLKATSRMEAPDWVSTWLEGWNESGSGEWRMAPSPELPSQWPRSESTASDVPRALEWEEHRLWSWDEHHLSGTTHLWLESPGTSLTVEIPETVQFLGAGLGGDAAVLNSPSPGVWDVTSTNGNPFRRVTLYWESTHRVAPNAFTAAVPTVRGRSKMPPLTTVFPSTGQRFLSNIRWAGNDWVDRALLRLEVLGDHIASHPDDTDIPQVAAQFRDLYEVTAEKLSRSLTEFNQSGSTRTERWAAVVARMDRAAKLLPEGKVVPASSAADIDDLLVDNADVNYGLAVANGKTGTGRMIPAWSGQLLCALASLLLGFPLLRQFIRREWSAWLAAHPHAAVGLLGVVWWLCLSPSIAGLALAVAATALGWTAHRESAAAGEG